MVPMKPFAWYRIQQHLTQLAAIDLRTLPVVCLKKHLSFPVEYAHPLVLIASKLLKAIEEVRLPNRKQSAVFMHIKRPTDRAFRSIPVLIEDPCL